MKHFQQSDSGYISRLLGPKSVFNYGELSSMCLKKQIVSKCFRLVHVKKSLINITETLLLTSDVIHLLKSGFDLQGLYSEPPHM